MSKRQEFEKKQEIKKKEKEALQKTREEESHLKPETMSFLAEIYPVFEAHPEEIRDLNKTMAGMNFYLVSSFLRQNSEVILKKTKETETPQTETSPQQPKRISLANFFKKNK